MKRREQQAPQGLRHWMFPATIILFVLFNLIPSFADRIEYRYDELNRLIRTENTATGVVVEYQYDAVGNRLLKQTTTPASPIQFQVTIRKDTQNTMPGVKAYLFKENGAYSGLTQTTDESGIAQFAVPRGSYRVHADYLGYQFWSDTVEVVTAASADLTIPHHTVSIAVDGTYQGAAEPLSGITVYLFTPSSAYLGLNQITGADGRVSFSLPDRDYKVRADYLGQQLFSPVFNAQDAAIHIPMAYEEITVIQGGMPVSGLNVYVFTSAGAYLGITGKTDASGKVTFRLPSASYKFRIDYLGNQYWSSPEAAVADQVTPVTVNTGGGAFTLTVLKGASDPLAGVRCYLFNEAGSYLGLSGTTDSNGQVPYNIPDGRYKFRVDYLGYQFWSDVADVPETMGLTKIIAHQAVTVTVTGSLAGAGQLKSGVPVYLFEPSGSYLSLNVSTDGNGRVTFNLPRQPFKVRADYLGQQFWSDIFTWEDKIVLIPEGTARVQVTMAGLGLPNVPVYVFSSAGSYLGISGTSDASGNVDFKVPVGTYKFRVDYQGSQHWTTAGIDRDVVNAVGLSTGGGQFALTIDRGAGPLAGVRTYVYSPAGAYLGMYSDSDATGRASFNLASGSYKFRVDYLGYQFWSDLFTVPDILSGSLSIPHRDVTITVEGVSQGSQPIAGVNVYLFTPSGSYLGNTGVTDGSGRVRFSLPDKGYKVRADYLGQQFWSNVFQFQDATVAIPRDIAQVIAKKSGLPVSGATVYLFSSGGSYLGLNTATNTEGKAEFLLPNRSYKFRVDSAGAQHWSAITGISEGQINVIKVNWD